MPPIFLIGYMGSGKTTLGRGVESRAHVSFIDLDDYIEEREGMTVSEIFNARGEDGFRKAERECLAELAAKENLLVACGGGTPCFFDNMEVMNNSGTTVWLDASVDKLHARLAEARSKRPLIAGKNDDELREFIVDSLEKRRPFYSRAKYRFCADELDCADELEASVGKFVERFL